jgi:hypothetical protein
MQPVSDEHGTGRETELKLRVDDLAALMKIATASGGVPENTAVQRNAFYDTADRALGTRGLVVRVRTEVVRDKVRIFVTAKGPGSRSGNLTSVLEEEVEIDQKTASGIRAGADPIAPLEVGGGDSRRSLIGSIRTTLGGRPVKLLGEFKNERTRIPVTLSHSGVSFRAVLELDRTHFPNEQVHHEVEMEVPDDVNPEIATHALEALFERAGVIGKSAPGKARRFFAAARGERLE